MLLCNYLYLTMLADSGQLHRVHYYTPECLTLLSRTLFMAYVPAT
uniref:Uncharacterized protein n=1 Tax=Arundo donax TaxID=35708 RepID=A0A0A9E123_ARUDO